jgi:hypothetical protein
MWRGTGMGKRKGVKTPAPENLTRQQQLDVVVWLQMQAEKSDGYARRYWTELIRRKQELRFEVDRCFDWHRAHGSECVDWVAAVRNWLRLACRSYLRRHGVTVGVE